MTCAYCGKAIKKAEQSAASYVFGMGYMHEDCRKTYDYNRLNDIIAERSGPAW